MAVPLATRSDAITVAQLPAAFASLPPAWRAALPGWTPQAQQQVIDGIRKASGDQPIGPADPFRALRLVNPKSVKVLIVGQDPYPTPGQADGMAFSAPKVSPRPSLRRIFDVLEADRPGWRRPILGRLDAWAQQGVLLLNSVLTVEHGRVGSHLDVSWQALTKQIVYAVARFGDQPTFMTWGSQAASFVAGALSSVPPKGVAGAPESIAGASRSTMPAPVILTARHPSNDFKREFMADGSHFAATADRINWWVVGEQASPSGATQPTQPNLL